MDPHDQHLLVVRPVEDPDAASLRKVARRAPEKVVLQFRRAGMLEAEYLTALGIDARHHMLDRAVLSRRVHALKNYEQRIPVRCIEQLLQRAQRRHVPRQQSLVVALRAIDRRYSRRPLPEFHVRAFRHDVVLRRNIHLSPSVCTARHLRSGAWPLPKRRMPAARGSSIEWTRQFHPSRVPIVRERSPARMPAIRAHRQAVAHAGTIAKPVTTAPATLAVVDMGSNSFRLEVGRVEGDQIYRLDTQRETLRIGARLDAKGNLTLDARRAALACLARFGERLAGLHPSAVRAVATNTFRVARNAEAFLAQAERALGFPIDVIPGTEEARLVYLGVAHVLPPSPEPRLVIDIEGARPSSSSVVAWNRKYWIRSRSVASACRSASSPMAC